MNHKKSVYAELLSVLVVVFLVSILFPATTLARVGEFELNCPYWFMLFDRAGYMDITYWYPSTLHPYSNHEMMTGDWAAAVSYSGLNETDTAEWLTDLFIIPSFSTGSPFDFNTYSVSNDPDNPVWTDPNQPSEYEPGSHNYSIGDTGNDAGLSKIGDGKLEVTIHYEVVDLDPNNWSPISFNDDYGSAYVKSERYVILQTYVFRNMHATEDITDLEFYQVMHGHPADAYSDLAGSYNITVVPDSLGNYVPYNSNHQTGNFRYDITLWNNTTGAHQDYMSFSSTVAPDEIGFDEFENLSSEMRYDIENRTLNGRISWENDDMAGAMMWNLPDLDPNESTFITLALMYGHGELVENSLVLTKTDDIDDASCGIDPTDPNNNEITYTIYYANPITDTNDPDYLGTVSDIVITDYLPDGIDLLNVTVTGGGVYNMFSNPRTVTWSNILLDAGDASSVTVTIEVVEAEPTGEIVNTAILTSDVGWVRAVETTDVCCFGGSIIYVDDTASGSNTGLNWNDAYNDLQDAFARASECTTTEIWVASGIYMPDVINGDRNISFELVDDVEIYGGFNGTETTRSDRDFLVNKTILSGDIDPAGTSDSYKVVHADSSITSSAILDGFIITDGYDGIYCDSGNPAVKNCVIADNHDDGVYCTGSDMGISWSIIKDNGGDGFECYGSGKTPTITNSKIRDNDDNGIYSQSSVPVIKNNWIVNNGADGSGYGINLSSPSAAATIRTNTIAHNTDEGVHRSGDGDPNISDCIIWQNNSNDSYAQLTGCTATYSCITNPADPNGVATGADTPDGNGNISANPDFAYPDPLLNNYHLDSDSPCIDKGNPSGNYAGEEDIDTDARVYNSRVDMGADEVSCTDVSNLSDFNGDGIVNYRDFAVLSKSWLHDDPAVSSDPNDIVNWNPKCDLNYDDTVDVDDLAIVADAWLWEACYRLAAEGTLMETMSMMSTMSYDISAPMAFEPVAVMSLEDSDTFIVDDIANQLIEVQLQFKADKIAEAREHRAYLASLPTTEERIAQAEDNILFLERIWLEDEEIQDHYTEQDWDDFIGKIETWIDDLKAGL